MEQPETRYAQNGDLNIAYQVVGDGPLDLVFVPGLMSHIDAAWSLPAPVHFFRGLTSFSRLILLDKRGRAFRTLSQSRRRLRTTWRTCSPYSTQWAANRRRSLGIRRADR